MSEIVHASWNVARGLGHEDRHPLILEGLKQLDADVLVLPEAFASSDPLDATDKNSGKFYDFSIAESLEKIGEFANEQGYELAHTPYEDEDTSRPSVPAGFEQHLVLLTRGDVASEAVRLGTRNAFRTIMKFSESDLPVVGYHAHFDDRNELARQGMVAGIKSDISNYADHIEHSQWELPIIVAGDLNGMHASTRAAKIAGSRGFKMVASAAPVARVKHLGTRLHEMADGGTMHELEELGLVDADHLKQDRFTFKGIKFGQLDHIMTRHLDVAKQGDNAFRLERFAGSDHVATRLGILATTKYRSRY